MENARWTGWIAFAGLLMVIIGGLDFFQGLIAVIRKTYYAVTPNQIIVFDVKTWGWITLLWGIVLVLAGLGLLNGAGWARWFSIVVGIYRVLHPARLRRELAVHALGADRAGSPRSVALRHHRPLGRRAVSERLTLRAVSFPGALGGCPGGRPSDPGHGRR